MSNMLSFRTLLNNAIKGVLLDERSEDFSVWVIGENSVQALNAIQCQFVQKRVKNSPKKTYKDIKSKQSLCIMYHKTELLRLEPSFNVDPTGAHKIYFWPQWV